MCVYGIMPKRNTKRMKGGFWPFTTEVDNVTVPNAQPPPIKKPFFSMDWFNRPAAPPAPPASPASPPENAAPAEEAAVDKKEAPATQILGGKTKKKTSGGKKRRSNSKSKSKKRR